MMSMKNEQFKNQNGSSLVETLLALLVLSILISGFALTHQTLGRRQRAIIKHRNESIQRLRQAQPFFPAGLPVLDSLGLDGRGSQRGPHR